MNDSPNSPNFLAAKHSCYTVFENYFTVNKKLITLRSARLSPLFMEFANHTDLEHSM